MTWSKLTDVTALLADINAITGIAAGGITPTEIIRLDGVNNNIQVQLDNKLDNSLAYNALWVGDASNRAAQLPTGPDTYVLTSVNGVPVWTSVSPPGNVSGVAPSTDNAIVRWNGTLADSIQNSAVIIDDTNNITGVATLSSGQVDILNQAELRLHETGSTNYVGIRSSAVMAADYTITLPAVAPGANTYLKYDGANYVWDVSGAGAGSFITLSDTFISYVGRSLQYLRVNVGETGVESVAFPSTTLTGDVTGSGALSIATTISNQAVTNAKFRNSVGLSVVGRSANTTGSVADIVGVDGQALSSGEARPACASCR